MARAFHTLLPALSLRGSREIQPAHLLSLSSARPPSGGAGSGILLRNVGKLQHHRLGQPACLPVLLRAHRFIVQLVLPWWLLEGISVDSLFFPFRDCDRRRSVS